VLFLAVVAVAAIAIVLVFRSAPRFTFAAWAGVLFLVPVWVGISAGISFSALSFVTILCVIAGIRRGLHWTIADTLVLAFLAVVMISFVLGGVLLGNVLTTALDWVLPYVMGRLILARLGFGFIATCIGLFTVAAATLALLEFVTGTNLFVLVPWSNSTYALWHGLQSRGGFIRAEGAFGHSISLGVCLSMGSIFILAARWSLGLRVAAIVTTGLAIVVTFSRIGLVCFALGLVLFAVFSGRQLRLRARIVFVGVALIGATWVLPFLSDVFASAGAEAEGSALYRLDLISLFAAMSPVGLSPDYSLLPNGDVYFGEFQSIDSALVVIGLRLGWVPLLMLCSLLLAAIVVLLRGKGNPPIIALVSQIPALAAVALITQMPNLIWFIGGLSVSLYILDRERAGGVVLNNDERALVTHSEWNQYG
jgi:hypothetical protein